MNYEWIGNTITKKNPNQKSKKLQKPHVNKKTTSEKANFCSNADFSLYFKNHIQIKLLKVRRSYGYLSIAQPTIFLLESNLINSMLVFSV